MLKIISHFQLTLLILTLFGRKSQFSLLDRLQVSYHKHFVCTIP